MILAVSACSAWCSAERAIRSIRPAAGGLIRSVRQRTSSSSRTNSGRRKKLSDAELLCLAVAQVLLGSPSQHHWLRFAYGRLGHLFPSHTDQLRLIDATPLPCGNSRQTVKRSQLAGWAGYGYCASHSHYYWG